MYDSGVAHDACREHWITPNVRYGLEVWPFIQALMSDATPHSIFPGPWVYINRSYRSRSL